MSEDKRAVEEIKVTPEMIEAGAEVLEGYLLLDDGVAKFVQEIYREMETVRRNAAFQQ